MITELCVDARMVLSSGIGTYLRNILPFLEQSPFGVRLIVGAKALAQLPWLTRFNHTILDAPIYSSEEQLKLPWMIPRSSVFWSPHYNAPLLPTPAKHRVVTVHDVNHLALSKHLTLAQKLYAKMVMKNAVVRAKKVITVSQFSKKEICNYLKVSPEKIIVTPLSADKKMFVPDEDGLSLKTKQRYGLPEKFFLFIGNVKPHKNLVGLLRGYLSAIDVFEDIHIVVVGKRDDFIHADKEAENFVEHPRLKNKVHFLGVVDDQYLPSLYRLAIAAVIPSFYEGFGLPALEAMSSGCPLVVSKIASLPEVCADAAVYFDPYRHEDIGQVLKQVALRPELVSELKEKGLHRSKEFCWKKCAAAHLQLFEELI